MVVKQESLVPEEQYVPVVVGTLTDPNDKLLELFTELPCFDDLVLNAHCSPTGKLVATMSVFPRRGSLGFPDDEPTTDQTADPSWLPSVTLDCHLTC